MFRERLRSSSRFLSLLGRSLGRCSGGRFSDLRVLLRCLSTSLSLTTVRRRPESQIVSEQLHDQCAVAVRLLGERVELGDCIIESLLGKVAGTVGGVEDLVVEDGEVQGKTEADWVGWGELSLGNIGGVLISVSGAPLRLCNRSYLVGLVSSGSCDLALLTGRELCKITVVVPFPI
jgi:hypothetical protein